MDNKTISYEQAKDHLNQLYDWSLNGLSCWSDFVSIAHNNDEMETVDFTKYGYTELVLFGKALTIFNNWGLEPVNEMIDEVIAETE